MGGHDRGELEAHIERHCGEFVVFHEIVSDEVHLDLYIVKATKDRPFHTLITGGISDQKVGGVQEELLMYLPVDWDLDFSAGGEQSWWPGRTLKVVGRYMVSSDRAVFPFETLALAEPPEALVAGSTLGGLMFVSPREKTGFVEFTLGGDSAYILWAMPITLEELAAARRDGGEPVHDLLEKHKVPRVIDPRRPSYLTPQPLGS